MKKILSFTVNHDVLERGVYVSRVDDDVVTYDIRMKKPNNNDYLENPAMHTIEHIFATFVRNSKFSNSVIYFGPMGCRTGFYLLLRDVVSKENVLKLVNDALKFIAEFEGDIPGNSKIECGNYLEHDLHGAKREAADMLEVVKKLEVEDMEYKN